MGGTHESGRQEGPGLEEPRGGAVAGMGKFAQDQIRDDVVAELGYRREDLDGIHPPVHVSHDDDIATHGPLHAAHAAKRDAQNSRLIESEKERLRGDYDKHIDAFTELHKDRAAKEAYNIRQEGYRAEIEGIAMSNASRRLVEEARENPLFDVYGSAQRLQELYSEELEAVSESHTLGRIKANARAAAKGEMAVISDHLERLEARRPSFDVDRAKKAGEDFAKKAVAEILSRDSVDLSDRQKKIVSSWIHNAIHRFATDNGLDKEVEMARMDQLFIRMGYPDLLSDSLHRVRTNTSGGMTMGEHQLRRQYESGVLGDAVDYLDSAAA